MASKIKVDTLETADGTGSITLNNPISGFTSTGIDDNATSTAITIDSSENVGVGTASPLSGKKLTVAGGAFAVTGQNTAHSANALVLGEEGSGVAQLRAYGPDTSTAGSFRFTQSSSDSSVSVETLLIDAAGHAIIGGGVTLGNGTTYAAANTLDDYEEGAYTPVVKAGSTVLSITNQGTVYTKIGRQVNISLYILFSGSASVSSISLPFASEGNGVRHAGSLGSYNMPLSNYSSRPIIESGVSTMGLWQMRNNTNSLFTISVDSGSELILSISYMTA